MQKIDFKNQMNLEFYHNFDETEFSQKDGPKSEGYNIIKNNDMLQYHYFSQEYNVVKSASILVLISITQNNIKHYIGFVALGTFTLDKKIRNQLLGPRFFPHIYHIKNTIDKFKNLKAFNILRIVFLPSFRGLGLNKEVQNRIIDFLGQNPDVFYLEISSQMLNNFDFLTNRFNKTFLNCSLDHFMPPKLSKKSLEFQKKAKGYKGDSKYIATTATYIFRNETNDLLLKILYKKWYNILIDDFSKINETIDIDSYEKEDIEYLKENKIAINLLNFYEMDYLKTLKFESFLPKKAKKITEETTEGVKEC
jgi:hypothetical protein